MATPARRQRAAPFSPIRPKKVEMIGAGPASPLHGFVFRSAQQVPPATPITQAITSATWLHDCVCAGGIQAKLAALQAFVPGDATIVSNLHKLVEDLGQRIGQAIREDALVMTMRTDISPQSTVMDDLVQQRTSEIVNVFFYFLNRILSDELERAPADAKAGMNFSSLLKSQRFTKSLLTCAMEVIVSTYKTSTLTFPATPHLLGIHPFDLATIIEPFVRADMSMPREIQRHFNSLEEKTLERLAWCKGSTLFEFLQTFHDSVKDHPPTGARDTKMEPPSTSSTISKPQIRKATSNSVLSVGSIAELAAMGGEDTDRTHTQAEDEHLPMAQCQSPVRRAPTSAFTAFSSPMRGVTTPRRRTSAGGPLPDRFTAVHNHDVSMPQGCDVCAFKALRMFFAKVMHLAARRLSDLCTRLNLSQEVIRNSYTLIEHVVYEQTNLLYNRHLDQIILSAVYGVCKANSGATQGPTVAFRDIIYQYSKQPQSNEEVFWTVVLEQSDPELEIMRRGDVISFYNSVFVNRVKSFLLTLREKKRGHATIANGAGDEAPNEPLPHGLSSPPRRIPILPNHNIYVSPMRPDRIDAIQNSMPPFTPRSKSLFATIGESAHGFRPSSHAFEAINRTMQPPAAATARAERSKIPKFGNS
jgi:retinoblastoma-like protein 1